MFKNFIFLNFLQIFLIFSISETHGLSWQKIVFTNVKGDFETAQTYCKSRQMTVISVKNEEENNLLNKLALMKNVGTFWTDGNDIKKEGTWKDSEDSLLKYKNWGKGQPDNWHGNENCAEIHADKLWNDIICNTKNEIVCLIGEDAYDLTPHAITFTDKKGDFATAQSYCKSLGLKVIRVKNDNENAMVNGLAKAKNILRYWVDGNDIESEGTWINSNLFSLKYTKWRKAQPDNWNNNENCAEVHDDQYWNDIICSTQNSIICYNELGSSKLSHNRLTFTNKKGDFATAQTLCKSLGLDLLRIRNNEENNFVNLLALARKIGTYWVDGNDIKVEGKWVNSDKAKLTYKNWKKGQPDNWHNNENCAEVHEDLGWNDIICSTQNAIICFDGERTTRRNPHELNADKVIFTNKKGNFHTAQSVCQCFGLKVIRVRNEEENILVNGLAKKNNIKRYWVDGNNIKTKGTWVDSDSHTLKYKKWGAGQPDNWNNNENCAEIHEDLFWNDIICSTENAIICYDDTRSYKLTAQNIVFTNLKDDFAAAQKLCSSKGLKVIRIRNDNENSFVNSFAKEKKISTYWVDGNDIQKEGTWVNSNKKNLRYTKWALSQPDNWNNNENCAEVHENQMWNDIVCTTKNSIICFNDYAERPEGSQELRPKDIVFTNKKTDFTTAGNHCKTLGKKLLQIKNNDENGLVNGLAVANGIDRYWVDGNDNEKEGTWVDSNKNVLKFKKWATGQPDNWHNNENCAEVHNDQMWNDIVCTTQNAVICYNDYNKKDSKELTSHQILFLNKKGDFQTAQQSCHAQGMKLIRVENDYENKLVNDLAVVKNVDSYWVDGNNIHNEKNWINSDNELLNYMNWKNGQPDNRDKNEHCAEVHADLFWDDTSCTRSNEIICYNENQHVPIKKLEEHVDAKGKKGEESDTETVKVELLLLPGKMTYQNGVNQCKGKKVEMVTIDSVEMDKVVFEFALQEKLASYWVDMNDIKNEGVWVTSDKDPVTYKNFASDEPNGGRLENCVISAYYKIMFWYDVGCETLSNVICYKNLEIVPKGKK